MSLRKALKAKEDAEMELMSLRAAVAESEDQAFLHEARIEILTARCRC